MNKFHNLLTKPRKTNPDIIVTMTRNSWRDISICFMQNFINDFNFCRNVSEAVRYIQKIFGVCIPVCHLKTVHA